MDPSADVEAAAKHIELRHGAEDRLTQRTMHGQACAPTSAWVGALTLTKAHPVRGIVD
jgi:hypothetical protein